LARRTQAYFCELYRLVLALEKMLYLTNRRRTQSFAFRMNLDSYRESFSDLALLGGVDEKFPSLVDLLGYELLWNHRTLFFDIFLLKMSK